jgi:hypothetical protein
MGQVPEQVLEEIAADLQAAAAEIGAKYGMSIAFDRIVASEADYDGIAFLVHPLDEQDLSDEARNSDFWKEMLDREGGK